MGKSGWLHGHKADETGREKYLLGKGRTLTNPGKKKGQKLSFPSAGTQKLQISQSNLQS